MSKYKVFIPSPSAKRMAANKKIIVKTNEKLKEYLIQTEQNEFEFEVGDEYSWVFSNKILDGLVFEVYIEYVNSTGTKKETKSLVPEKIS